MKSKKYLLLAIPALLGMLTACDFGGQSSAEPSSEAPSSSDIISSSEEKSSSTVESSSVVESSSEAHTHEFDPDWSYDENYHWHACTGEDCEELEGKEAHKGGTATCSVKAHCEVCGLEYGDYGDHVYNKEIKSAATLKSEGSDCKHKDVYFKSCECGAIGTETFEVANDKHSYTGVITTMPTFEDQGVKTFTCSLCGDSYTENFSATDEVIFDGEGSEAKPYKIDCLADLDYLAKRVAANNLYENNYFVLTADISDEVTFGIGADANKYFKGSLDGQNHYIKVNINGGKYSGLFGKLETGTVISNLTVKGSVVSSGQFSGGVAGSPNGAKFLNVTNEANVTCSSSDVGGIAGFSRGQLTNCVNKGKIVGTKDVGGIVGRFNAGNNIVSEDIWMQNCSNTGVVSSNDEVNPVIANSAIGSSAKYIGLLLGHQASGSVKIAHTLVEHPAVAPTCVAAGNKKYYSCSDEECTKLFLDDYAIFETTLAEVTLAIDTDAHTPSSDSTTVPASYATKGSVTGKCELCQASLPGSETAAQKDDLAAGTQANPYLINNAADMAALIADSAENDFTDKYILVNATDLTVTSAIGSDTKPFNGSFDGNGKEITLNISIDGTNGGLFAITGNKSSIKNVKVKGSVTTTGKYAGGIAGQANGLIENCNNAAAITALATVGGVVGMANATAELKNCQNTGVVVSTETTAVNTLGGVVGFCYCAVTGCVNKANLTGKQRVGGVIGVSKAVATFKDCINEGDISGTQAIGGVVGYADNAATALNGCINKGAISNDGKYLGGVCGYAQGAVTFTNCTNEGALTCTATLTKETGIGGIVGYYNKVTSTTTNTIIGCTNSGTITSSSAVTGGIVGMCGSYHSLSGCKNTASVTSTQSNGAGGLIGSAYSGHTFTDCLNVDANYIGNNTTSVSTEGCSVIPAV